MIWNLSHRADAAARKIADRHYNRQKVGTPQFVPPGRCLVLKAPGAFWVTSWPFAEYVKHRWPGAWICSAFRRENTDLPPAHEMILDAVACTRDKWPDVPELGMVTFLDPTKVRPVIVRGVPTFGRTWTLAGFKYVGVTGAGLLAFQLLPTALPLPKRPMQPEALALDFSAEEFPAEVREACI